MSRSLCSWIVGAVLLSTLGCGAKTETHGPNAKNFEVVPEGAASGVSTTLNGAGEVPPPGATGTGMDTTTDLSLLPNAATTTAAMPTLAGQLPPPNVGYGAPPAAGYPGYTPRPATRPRSSSSGSSSSHSGDVRWSNEHPADTTTTSPTSTDSAMTSTSTASTEPASEESTSEPAGGESEPTSTATTTTSTAPQ